MADDEQELQRLHNSDHYAITVTIVVKAESDDHAQAAVIKHLNGWLAEDIGTEAPFPLNSLLHFTINKSVRL